MTIRTAIPGNPRLSDGRAVRALKGTFTQEQMFGLYKSGLFDPFTEKIMGVKEHDDSLNVSQVYKAIIFNGWWRTDRYAAYRRGFEKEDLPIGDKLVLIEDGIARTLDIPDVPVAIVRPDGKSETVGLRTVIGMLDFNLAKLRYDPGTSVVSVATDFNPETDVRVVDIMRPGSDALVDGNGYPLKSKPSDSRDNTDARHAFVRHANEFEGESTGYHASVARNVSNLNNGDDLKRIVDADVRWSNDSGVAVVEREPAPRIRFDEPHSQSPYRDAPGIMESPGSRVLGPEDEP